MTVGCVILLTAARYLLIVVVIAWVAACLLDHKLRPFHRLSLGVVTIVVEAVVLIIVSERQSIPSVVVRARQVVQV